MVRKSPRSEMLLGKHLKRMEQAYAADQRRRYRNLMLLCELLDKDYQAPGMTTSGAEWEEVAQWWPFHVLRQAAEENDSEGCKRLLYFFLLELDIRLPQGVLAAWRSKRGRPNETEEIYKAWIARGKPKPTWRVCEDLARIFYPGEIEQAQSDPGPRTKIRARIRATLLRHELAITKFARI